MTRNAVFHDSGAFDDGSPIASFPGAVSSVFTRTGAVTAAAGDYYGAVPAALTGATQASRFVGATVSGAPVSGTFAVGDHVLSLADAKWYVCTVAGTPGTWVTPSAGAGVTYGTPALTLGTAAAAGSTDEAIRRDSTIVAFDATAPTTQAFGDSAATGSAAVAARRDHKHAMPANPVSIVTPAVVLGSSAAAGSAGTLIASDATIAAFDATVPSTQAFGDAAAVGTAAFAARRDHKHAMMADPFLGTTAAAAIGGVIWTVVTKAADEDVSSSTTVQDDNHLFFTATSGGVYEFELILIYASPLSAGTPDIKFDLGEGGGTRGLYWKLGLATNDVTNFSAFPADQSTAVSGGTAAAKRMLYVAGTYLGGGGTFKVRWAQNTSDGNPTTVYTGSVLRYRRIV